MKRSPVVVVGSLLVLLLGVWLAVWSGCRTVMGPPRPTPVSAAGSPGFPRTLTDVRGQPLVLAARPKRIVSLAPSNTEILFALGAGDRVVADTESCDYPPEAKNRPHIGGLAAGDLEKIEAQTPDLVLSVGSLNQKLITALENAHVPTLVVNPHTVNEVYDSIRLIGQAVGQDAQAEMLVGQMKARIEKVRQTTARATARPKVLILYSVDPIYTSPPDSFIHDMIEVAGGEDIVQSALPQNVISPSVVIVRAPEVILCAPALREKVTQIPGWSVVPAVKNHRFFPDDSDSVLTRPTPRLADGVEALAHYLHPELFSAGSGAETGKR